MNYLTTYSLREEIIAALLLSIDYTQNTLKKGINWKGLYQICRNGLIIRSSLALMLTFIISIIVIIRKRRILCNRVHKLSHKVKVEEESADISLYLNNNNNSKNSNNDMYSLAKNDVYQFDKNRFFNNTKRMNDEDFDSDGRFQEIFNHFRRSENTTLVPT